MELDHELYLKTLGECTNLGKEQCLLALQQVGQWKSSCSEEQFSVVFWFLQLCSYCLDSVDFCCNRGAQRLKLYICKGVGKKICQAVVAHTFDPSTGEAHAFNPSIQEVETGT